MYKIVAIILLIIFILGVTAVSIGISCSLRASGVPELGVWVAAFFIFIICSPVAISLENTMWILWDYD